MTKINMKEVLMRYLYKGPFSIEDGENGKIQQWFNYKTYSDNEIYISEKRLKTLQNLGYITEIKPTKTEEKIDQKTKGNK